MKRVWVALLSWGVSVLGCDGRLKVFVRVSDLEPSAGGAGEGGGTAEVAGGLSGQPDGASGDAGAAGTAGLWIDDFEDRDTHAEPPLGWWYKVNDGTGTQTLSIEPSTGKPTGAYALRSAGAGFTDWGVMVGVNFAGESVIDASRYRELRFWAFAAPGTNHQVTVDLIASGDVRYYAPALSLGEDWAQYRVPLADFRGKNRTPLDPTMLQGLQFELGPSSKLDIWLDDVELVP